MEKVRTSTNRFILALSLALILLYDKMLPHVGDLFGSPASRLAFVFAAGVVTHEGLHGIVYRVLNRSALFQRLVWRDNYLDGFWVYTSFDDQRRRRRGVWRIKQDLRETCIVGFGIDDEFFKISRVTSLSPIMIVDGLYQVVNRRIDWDQSHDPIMSVSTFSLDAPPDRGIFSYPMTFRGETQIFGGPRSGLTLTNAVWRRYDHCRTEEEVLDALRAENG